MSFKRFDPQDLVISAESVTGPVWTNNTTTLTTFFTSSVQENSTPGTFYLDVYQTGSTLDESEVQFSIAYCDKKGSGSVLFNSAVTASSPSSVNYGTFRTLVLGNEESEITFSNKVSEYFYALVFDRARYKEKLLPGTLQLRLTNGATTLVLRDNSTSLTSLTFTDAGRVYDLIGTIGTTEYQEGSDLFTQSGSYGKLLPDIGVILLNGQSLDADSGVGGLNLGIARSNNTDDQNPRKLFNAMVAGAGFKMNYEETISSNFVFVRARNSEFNYSSNPSYLTGSGELRFPLLINDPRSYITTVGMYNDNNDLLAVSKLSRPLLKDSRKEALIRVKLDF